MADPIRIIDCPWCFSQSSMKRLGNTNFFECEKRKNEECKTNRSQQEVIAKHNNYRNTKEFMTSEEYLRHHGVTIKQINKWMREGKIYRYWGDNFELLLDPAVKPLEI